MERGRGTDWPSSLHLEGVLNFCRIYAGILEDEQKPEFRLSDAAAPAWDTVTVETRKEKASRAKWRLNQECADKMTVALLALSDPAGEITTWLKAVGAKLRP
jgi:hypothetical protein